MTGDFVESLSLAMEKSSILMTLNKSNQFGFTKTVFNLEKKVSAVFLNFRTG